MLGATGNPSMSRYHKSNFKEVSKPAQNTLSTAEKQSPPGLAAWGAFVQLRKMSSAEGLGSCFSGSLKVYVTENF